jgi:glycosyltransferase involved in cell wall biosynthesis
MNHRLLAISWDMPPMSGPRAVQVSRTLKHLVPLGWDSWVVCFEPRSNRYNRDVELAARLGAPAGVTRVPVASLEERLLFRSLWRIAPPLKLLPDEKWVWIGAATRAARRLVAERRFDAVVSYAQPWSDHLVGLRIRRATGLPWVAHFSDPWTDSPYLRGRPWQQRIWARMEASVVRAADALVFVNRHTADRVMRKYPAEYRAKAHVVPHGFDRGELGPIAPAARDDRLTLVYTGRFYDMMRTPEPLLRAIAALRGRRPLERELRVVFVGTPVASHRRLASALRLDDIVEFVGRRSFIESAAWAAAADVLLLIDAPADENLFLPSKLVDYVSAGKPILGLTPPCGASADLVRALGYPVVPPDDETAIASALEDLVTRTRPRRPEPASAHAAVAREYDIACTTAAFARVLEHCA